MPVWKFASNRTKIDCNPANPITFRFRFSRKLRNYTFNREEVRLFNQQRDFRKGPPHVSNYKANDKIGFLVLAGEKVISNGVYASQKYLFANGKMVEYIFSHQKVTITTPTNI